MSHPKVTNMRGSWDIRNSVEALIRSEVGQEDSWNGSSGDIGSRKAEVSYHCFWFSASKTDIVGRHIRNRSDMVSTEMAINSKQMGRMSMLVLVEKEQLHLLTREPRPCI